MPMMAARRITDENREDGMGKVEYLRRLAVAGPLIALFALPASGQAQSVNLGSSMSGYCVGADCSAVRFFMNLHSTNAHVDLVRIFSHDASKWVFGGFLGAKDMNGNDLNWTGTLGNGNLLLRSAGDFGAEPIWLDVAMSTYATQPELSNGSLTFSGQGNTQGDGLGSDISFGGTVTPEPASCC
jgi:hypothetical protein